jgi:hypothetical protein
MYLNLGVFKVKTNRDPSTSPTAKKFPFLETSIEHNFSRDILLEKSSNYGGSILFSDFFTSDKLVVIELK